MLGKFMTKVFISYAHLDIKIVQPIVRKLQDEGFEVWFDSRKIKGGALWKVEIEKGVASCDSFLLFVSPHSLRSTYVRKELRFAVENKKHIVPLLLEKVDMPRSLKPILSDIQWIDHKKKNWWSRLLIALDHNEENQSEQERRLEGAMPQTARIGHPIVLLGMISLLNSEGLRKYLLDSNSGLRITPSDVRENGFPLRFPVDSSTNQMLELELFVTVNTFASGFQVDPPTRKILVPPRMNSPVFSFSLTSTKANENAFVALELYKDEEKTTLIGSLTITTKVKSLQGEMAEGAWNLVALLLTPKKHELEDIGAMQTANQIKVMRLKLTGMTKTFRTDYVTPRDCDQVIRELRYIAEREWEQGVRYSHVFFYHQIDQMIDPLINQISDFRTVCRDSTPRSRRMKDNILEALRRLIRDFDRLYGISGDPERLAEDYIDYPVSGRFLGENDLLDEGSGSSN
jgi:hypothetical protein